MEQEQKSNDLVLEETIDTAAQQGAENSEVQEEKAPQAPEAEAAPTQAEETQAIRFKTLRRAREQAELERDELKRKLERLEAARTQPAQPKQEESEEDFAIGPDDFVEGKHLSSVDKKIKRLEKQLAQQQQQNYASSVETQLKMQYRDFDDVVNKENLEVLSAAYPEIAKTLGSSNDLYNKAVTAYTMIKQFGISEKTDYEKPKGRVQQNVAKPRPVASVNAQATSDSPLSQANAFAQGLTPELKRQLYKEMIEAKKNR